MRRVIWIVLLGMLWSRPVWADWEPTKPAQTQTVSQGMTDTQENFAAINDGTATVAGTGGASFVFEGATADAFETTVSVADPTADRTVTLPDATGTVVLSTLATNAPDVANSVYGTSNNWVFEGATADAFETSITVTDPTADRTVTLPNTSVDLTATAPALTLSTTNGAGTATTVLRTDATIAAFDATVPAALGTAAAGSATVAARRDHVHPFTNVLKAKLVNYSGNGADSRSITGVGFQPDYVRIISSDDSGRREIIRTPTMAGDFSQEESSALGAANYIQAFESDGFQIGTNDHVNNAASVYDAICMDIS